MQSTIPYLKSIPGSFFKWASGLQLPGLLLLAGLGACASLPAIGGSSWKEEVLLHDGSTLIVKRSQTYGGRHEIDQSPPVREHTLSFTLSDSGKDVSWTSEYGEDIGRTNFNAVALHILDGSPYLIAVPNLCLSYNKWGRPNPPYLFWKYDGETWNRIALDALPAEFTTINLIVNNLREKDIEKLARERGYVPAKAVQEINSSLRQPEYRSVLREPLTKERITRMCEERVLYKGHWILPDDPVARKFIDRVGK